MVVVVFGGMIRQLGGEPVQSNLQKSCPKWYIYLFCFEVSPGYLEPPPIIPDQGDISEVVVLSQFFQLTVFTEFVTHVNSVVVQIILNSRTAILLLKKVKVYEKVCNFCCVNILPCNTAGFTFIFCSLIAPPHPPKKAKKTPVFLFFDQCFECFLFYFLGDFCQKQLRVHQWDVLEYNEQKSWEDFLFCHIQQIMNKRAEMNFYFVT